MIKLWATSPKVGPIVLANLLFMPWHPSIFAQGSAPPVQDNGIEVLSPKQYPYRHLEKMIDDLDGQLAQARLVDAAKLAQQVGALQGSSRRTRQLSATVTQSPLPGVETNLEAGEDGELVPKTASVNEGAVTPTPPALETLSSGGVPLPNFGFAGSDVLAEQVQLQYQVYNLRLLQRRAISDRFFDDGTHQGSKVLALVGFTVELEPRRQHRRSAAVVEITIAAPSGKTAPSLVALMPEERTYNSVAHSSKSNAFGGAALAGVFSLGFSGEWQSEKLYLFQDNDTLAFSRARDASRSSELAFGWQFRPVLGRGTVDPGRRHLFAILALDQLESSVMEQTFPFKVSARSYWLKYSSKHRVARGAPRDPRSSAKPWDLEIRNAFLLHKGWSPDVASVAVSSVDRDSLLVKVRGSNFQPAPTVQIGNRTLTSKRELVHRSDGSFQFVAPAKELLEKQVLVTGSEYGFSTPLEQSLDSAADTGLRVESFGFGPTRQGNIRNLVINLASRDDKKPPNLHGRSVFTIFSGEVYELPAERWAAHKTRCDLLVGTIPVPTSHVKIDSEILVKIPFLGDRYVSSSKFHMPVGISAVELLDGGDPMVWGLVGWGFSDDVLKEARVYAGDEYKLGSGLTLDSPHLLRLKAPRDKLSKQKKLLALLPGYLEPITLRAPGVPHEKKAPTLTGPPPTAAQNSSGSVTFKGTDLKSISKVTFEGDRLQTELTKAGLRVFLTRAVSKHKGSVELLGFWDDAKFVVLELTIN